MDSTMRIDDSVSIRSLKLWVLSGHAPIDFPNAECMFGGVQQRDGVAKIGNYIVKRLVAPAHFANNIHHDYGWMPPKPIIPIRGLRKAGMCRPRYWTLGNGWVAQEFYRQHEEGRHKTTKPFLKTPSAQSIRWKGVYLDLHTGNYGVNRKGFYTAFDW